jgi:hypothetical protein
MNAAPTTSESRSVLGMISLVLGTIAFLLFFLPILAIPISGFGLVFGILGTLLATFSTNSNLRWSLLGLAVSLLAMLINLSIIHAP